MTTTHKWSCNYGITCMGLSVILEVLWAGGYSRIDSWMTASVKGSCGTVQPAQASKDGGWGSGLGSAGEAVVGWGWGWG